MKKSIIVLSSLIIIITISFLVFKKNKSFFKKLKNRYEYAQKKEVTNVKGSVYGIDVSHHQKQINWKKVKTWQGHKINFVYVKATEGTTYKDNTYKFNFYEAKKNHLLVGSYHYFRTTSAVKTQFKNFVSVVKKQDQDLIPLIDVEEIGRFTTKQFNDSLKLFIQLIEKEYNRKPMIYTVNSFYNRYLAGKYTKYHFLIGRYGKNAPFMKDHSNWTIWQFSESGRIDGISKAVDIDVLNQKFKLKDILLN